jgi:hypothetical protein
MNDTNVVADTVAETLKQLAPALIGAALLKNPSAAQVAPLVLQLLQTATQLHSVGTLNDQQLADLFVSVGAGVQVTHNAWVAMNEADKVALAQVRG